MTREQPSLKLQARFRCLFLWRLSFTNDCREEKTVADVIGAGRCADRRGCLYVLDQSHAFDRCDCEPGSKGGWTCCGSSIWWKCPDPVSYTHLRVHETGR